MTDEKRNETSSRGKAGWINFGWFDYLEAIHNAPPGTWIDLGEDPSPYLGKSKPKPEDVGLDPSRWK